MPCDHCDRSPDPHVEAVVALLRQRSRVGVAKYGATLERTDIDLIGWLNHAREEALDLAAYLTRAIHELQQGGERR